MFSVLQSSKVTGIWWLLSSFTGLPVSFLFDWIDSFIPVGSVEWCENLNCDLVNCRKENKGDASNESQFHEEDEEIVSSYLVWGGIALHYADMYHALNKQRNLHQFLLTVVKSIFQVTRKPIAGELLLIDVVDVRISSAWIRWYPKWWASPRSWWMLTELRCSS